MINFIKIFLISGLFSTVCYAGILNERALENHLGTYYHTQISAQDPLTKIDFNIVRLTDNGHALLYLQPVKSQSEAKLMDDLDIDFKVAINGGFYTPDFRPVGLLIDQGKVVTKFKKNRLLTSCITIDEKGKMQLIPRCETAPRAYYAMQTGPIIMDHGKVTDDIKALETKSKIPSSYFNEHARTIVAEAGDKSLLLIVTSSMTLDDEIHILQNNPKALGVDRIESAVNLDGGASSGMYIRFPDDPVYIQELMPVKVLLLFR